MNETFAPVPVLYNYIYNWLTGSRRFATSGGFRHLLTYFRLAAKGRLAVVLVKHQLIFVLIFGNNY